ncbi:hypothetical protein HAZT_HAZT000646 [Hyalella azteca]|uniref:C2H2-type domain-containing protein n=1 Tax=Hyalella azteca TaxID=294128 RepID=A0A6A0HAB6_HYAAZ|nr:hypothetical protein HAZT_HAZT000646 [Hyalella azteca]
MALKAQINASRLQTDAGARSSSEARDGLAFEPKNVHRRQLGVVASSSGSNPEGQSGLSCHFCGKWFMYPKDIRRHLRVHTGEKPFACPLCPYRASQKGNVKQHLVEFAPLYGASSDSHQFKMGYPIMQEDGIRASSSHNRPAPHNRHAKLHECPVCERRFIMGAVAGVASLDAFVSVAHHDQIFGNFGDTRRLTRPSSDGFGTLKRQPPRIHACSYCAKTFAKSEDLKRHIRVHTGERPYCCNKCPYKSALKGNLKQHLKTHLKHNTFNLISLGQIDSSSELNFKSSCASSSFAWPTSSRPSQLSQSSYLANELDHFSDGCSPTDINRRLSHLTKNLALGNALHAGSSLGRLQQNKSTKGHPCSMCPKSFFKTEDLKRHRSREASAENEDTVNHVEPICILEEEKQLALVPVASGTGSRNTDPCSSVCSDMALSLPSGLASVLGGVSVSSEVDALAVFCVRLKVDPSKLLSEEFLLNADFMELISTTAAAARYYYDLVNTWQGNQRFIKKVSEVSSKYRSIETSMDELANAFARVFSVCEERNQHFDSEYNDANNKKSINYCLDLILTLLRGVKKSMDEAVPGLQACIRAQKARRLSKIRAAFGTSNLEESLFLDNAVSCSTRQTGSSIFDEEKPSLSYNDEESDKFQDTVPDQPKKSVMRPQVWVARPAANGKASSSAASLSLDYVHVADGGWHHISKTDHPEKTQSSNSMVDFDSQLGVGFSLEDSGGQSKNSGIVCPECGQWCAFKSQLVKHMYIHTGEKPFECPFCPYKARQRGTLNKHIKGQHHSVSHLT